MYIGKRFSQQPNPQANAYAPLQFGPMLSQPLTEISGQASVHTHFNTSLENDIPLSNGFAVLANINNKIDESQDATMYREKEILIKL